MIEAHNITRTFGRTVALRSVSFRVEADQCVLLAGPNGAGKTTLLRILAGFAPPAAGFVRIAGYDMLSEGEEARSSLGYVPESLPMYDDMRVTEYLRYRGLLRNMSRRRLRQRIMELTEQFALVSNRRTMIGALARGQRARVALADALLHEPEVLLLDNPLTALDMEHRAQVINLLAEAVSGRAVIMSSHFPDETAILFNRVMILRAGRLLAEGGQYVSEVPKTKLGEYIRNRLSNPDQGFGGRQEVGG